MTFSGLQDNLIHSVLMFVRSGLTDTEMSLTSAPFRGAFPLKYFSSL